MNPEEAQFLVTTAKAGIKALWECGESVAARESLSLAAMAPDADGLTASAGANWEKFGDQYHLYEGLFKVGGDTRATIYGGTVHAAENSTVESFNDSRVVLSGKGNLFAHDQTLVVTDPEEVFTGKLTLSNEARVTQNRMALQGDIVDLRARPDIPNKIWLPTSTVEKPFMYDYKPFDADGNLVQNYQRMRDSVVQIRRPINGVDNGTGTGFWLGDRTFITAAHCIPKGYDGPIKLTSAAGSVFSAAVEKLSYDNDVALLTTTAAPKSGSMTAMRLGTSAELKPGEDMMMVGFPGIRDLAHAYPGKILAPRLSEQAAYIERPDFISKPGREFVSTDAFGHPGTSGGPAVNLKSGEVIGLTHGGRPYPNLPVNKYSHQAIDNLLLMPAEKISELLNSTTV